MSYYCQGVFKPSAKYKGILPCIYRSEPERKIMCWLDSKDFIVEWSSESVVIPYLKPIDNKIHHYYPDFLCKFKDKSGNITTHLIEYKPYKQTIQPVQGKKTGKTFLNECLTWSVNASKFKAAQEYCRTKGWKFLIITEKDIN